MPSKKDVEKRRVARTKAADAQQRSATAAQRKRRRTTGLVAGFLAVAMIFPLVGGLVVWLDGDDDADLTDDELEPTPAAIRPLPAGAELTGPTPCPATDGQERTTTFAEPPPMCIDPGRAYTVTLVTDVGEIVVGVDPALDPEAANLFVTMARYGLYDDMPFSSIVPDGLAVTGDPGPGNAGFTVPTSSDAYDGYDVGTVTMLADLDGTIGSRFAFLATPAAAASFADDPAHPLLGSVLSGQDTVDAVIALGSSPETSPLPVLDLRIRSTSVVEGG